MGLATLQKHSAEYLEFLKKQPTAAVCDCEWEEKLYPGGTTRKVIANENPICSVHSKEGLLLGFIFWLWENAEVDTLVLTDYNSRLALAILSK